MKGFYNCMTEVSLRSFRKYLKVPLKKSTYGCIHFLEGGGGWAGEFRGGSLTFCLPKKGGSA